MSEPKTIFTIKCPECFGGHFRPCQICADTGVTDWIPDDGKTPPAGMVIISHRQSDMSEDTPKAHTSAPEVLKPAESELTQFTSKQLGEPWGISPHRIAEALRRADLIRWKDKSLSEQTTVDLARAYRERAADCAGWKMRATDSESAVDAIRAELKTAADALRISGDEVQRLRAALERIAKRSIWGDEESAYHMRDIAREAIAAGKEAPRG